MKRKSLIPFGALAAAALTLQILHADDFLSTTLPVGRTGNGLMTPVNQITTPAGTQLDLPGMRPQALALSPDGKLLVTAGLSHELVTIDPATGKIRQHVVLPSGQSNEEAPATAPILEPDGR